MREVTLLHDPRCSESRARKAALDERGVAYAERRYLEDPRLRGELDALRAKLDLIAGGRAAIGPTPDRPLGLLGSG